MNRRKSEENKDEPKVRQTIRVTPDLWYKVKAAANWNHKSVNDAVTDALEVYVKSFVEQFKSSEKAG
jgi:predicted HicB family RNase H-like nuclease